MLFDVQSELAEVLAERGETAPLPRRDLLDALDRADERAAILEFDAGMSRAVAESRAIQAHEPAILAAIGSGCQYPSGNVCYGFLEHLIARGRVIQSHGKFLTVQGAT